MKSTQYAAYSLCKNVIVWPTTKKKQAKENFTLEQVTKALSGE